MTDQTRKTGARTLALRQLDDSLRTLNALAAGTNVLPTKVIPIGKKKEVSGYSVSPNILLGQADGELYVRPYGQNPIWVKLNIGIVLLVPRIKLYIKALDAAAKLCIKSDLGRSQPWPGDGEIYTEPLRAIVAPAA